MCRVLLLAAALVLMTACGTDPRADRLAAAISDAAVAHDIMIIEPVPAPFSRDPAIILSYGGDPIGPVPSEFSRTAAERLAFLCETVAPIARAAGLDDIDVAWEGGPHLSDCPPS